MLEAKGELEGGDYTESPMETLGAFALDKDEELDVYM